MLFRIVRRSGLFVVGAAIIGVFRRQNVAFLLH